MAESPWQHRDPVGSEEWQSSLPTGLPEGWEEDFDAYPNDYTFGTNWETRESEGYGPAPPGNTLTDLQQMIGNPTAGEYRDWLKQEEIIAGNIELNETLGENQDTWFEEQGNYLDFLQAEKTLSPEESAEFEEEYELRKAALEEQFDYESAQYGGKQMADLIARGVWDTTTGDRAIGEQTYRQDMLMKGNVAQLREAEILAKSDMSAAKTKMAQQGYQLTSGLLQDSLSKSLEISTSMQNYYQDIRGSDASAALQRALDKQGRDQASYNNRVSTTMGIAGIAAGFA